MQLFWVGGGIYKEIQWSKKMKSVVPSLLQLGLVNSELLSLIS